MRTKWLLRLATFLVVALTLQACRLENITRVTVVVRTPLVGRPDTTGTCITTYTAEVDSAFAVGNEMQLDVGENALIHVERTTNPANCVGKRRDFDFRSRNTAVASATRMDSLTGRVLGLAPGTTIVDAFDRLDTTFTLPVNVRVLGTVTPTTVSVSPTGQTRSSGYACTNSIQMTATTANPSGLSGVWSVSGVTGATVSNTGLVGWPSGSSGTITVTFTASNGAVGSTTVVVNTNACASLPPTITMTPASVCFSTIVGSASTANIAVSVTNANLSEVRLRSNIAGVTMSGSGANWVATKSSSATVANGSINAVFASDTNAVISSIPVQIRSEPCPGTTSSITYTPSTTSGAVGTVDTLTAVCVRGADIPEDCKPFWTSSHPHLISVQGTERDPVTGLSVGVRAVITRLGPTNGIQVEICAQWSVSRVTPRRCFASHTVP